jgi:hypothetical protein
MERRTSVFIPCSLAISRILSSCFSTGLTSSKGLPCHPAPTSHHLPLVSDWRRSLSVTRSGSFVRTADQLLPNRRALLNLRRRFLPREERKRFGSFFADFREVRVSSMNFVRTLGRQFDLTGEGGRKLTSYPVPWSCQEPDW